MNLKRRLERLAAGSSPAAGASLNPVASAKVANRLIEAHERKYWSPDPEMLDVLRRAGEELEDRLEGVGVAA